MRNRHQDGIFEYLINGLDQATQATLRYMYQHSRMLDEVNLQKEKEQFKQEVAQEIERRKHESEQPTETT